MRYIVLDWRTYLRNPAFWQKVSIDYAIPLHIGADQEITE